jgi:predicted nucleic acid-binding protein
MATTAVDRVFLDTNILVYATLQTAPLHSIAQRRIHDLQRAGIEIWVSRQILRELLATVTRPQSFSQAIPIAVAAADVARFQSAFRIAEDGPGVMANLLTLCLAIPVGGKQIHDANIVATMQTYGIDKLLTHNTVDFARYQSLITVIPLV